MRETITLGTIQEGAIPFQMNVLRFWPFSKGDCRDPSTAANRGLPETYGSGSRCFAGTLRDESELFDNYIRTGCYEFEVCSFQIRL